MRTNVATVDVAVPVEVAYDQWSHLEMLPAFTADVRSASRLDPDHFRWVVSPALGPDREVEVEVAERRPAERMLLRSHTPGHPAARTAVEFEPTAPGQTRMTLRFEREPSTLRESVADRLGLVRRELREALRGFKTWVEARPTGVELNASYEPTG